MHKHKPDSHHNLSLLIVDDDEHMLAYLSQYFLRRSYAVTVARDGEEARRLALANNYDLIVLDNLMPKLSGSEVCAYLRNTGITTPVIILSAQACISHKIELLNTGADDYLTKPFHIDELLARINSILRRAGTFNKPKPLVVEDIIMDRSGHLVTRDGDEVALTVKEFKILEVLMERKGLLVPREALVKYVWGVHANPSTHSLDTHLVNLRRKLCINDRPNVITTIPGFGYRFF